MGRILTTREAGEIGKGQVDREGGKLIEMGCGKVRGGTLTNTGRWRKK